MIKRYIFALAMLPLLLAFSCDATDTVQTPTVQTNTVTTDVRSVKNAGSQHQRPSIAFDTQSRFREIAKNAIPAVGYVYSLEAEEPPSFSLLRSSGLGLWQAVRRYFSTRMFVHYRVRNTGSGFLINKRGHMLTNYHVVQNADRVLVKLGSEEIEAAVLGGDPLTDIAMIKIRPHYNNTPLKLGDSDSLQVGEWVLAIGNPYSLGSTFTAGVVSALKRDDIGIVELEDFIQTDAAINPGNSGGPLINMDGEVMGINSAIYATGAGLGFAVPSNMASDILPLLAAGKRVERGMLGIGLQKLTGELASALKMDRDDGVLVRQVQKGMPADLAGVKPGDLITKINGKHVLSPVQVKKTVLSMHAGAKVRLNILRDGKEMVFNPTLVPFEPLL
ncbi:MAG: S1C family serine protease [Nitrospinota bacterium]